MSAAGPRVLFLTAGEEDYLGDALMHGLRTLLGPGLVDVPRRDPMYNDYPADRRSQLYGRGFTLYGLLDEIQVEREGAIDAARDGAWDLVVFADVWRTPKLIADLLPYLKRAGAPYVFIDGFDSPAVFGHGPHWWMKRVRGQLPPGRLPRIHAAGPYMKREITPGTWFWSHHMLAPPPLHRVLPLRGVEPIAFAIPGEKIVDSPPAKDKLLGAHIVDQEVAHHVDGAGAAYLFDREDAYYADLQRSRFAITTKRAGWDCMRHYEIAANGAVPCFRRLGSKPELCAPHGLGTGNCLVYRDWADLQRQLEAVTDDDYGRLQRGALEWARENTTTRRAEALLERMGLREPAAAPLGQTRP